MTAATAVHPLLIQGVHFSHLNQWNKLNIYIKKIYITPATALEEVVFDCYTCLLTYTVTCNLYLQW